MGICCVAQETQTGALYQPRGGGMVRETGGVFKREGMYVYQCIPRLTLRFDRQQQNFVKQLSFNKK